MKKAVGLIELLIVVIVIITIYFTFFRSGYGRSNPFEEQTKVKTQQQIVEDKIQQIEDTKALQKKIESNLNEEF
ncbi:hypothetical protein IJ541_09800 [bacterium]|nr:hypothetical protein [bacterium]